MALLQGDNYIRVLKDGEFEVYNSQEERELIKEAPSIEDIKAKYDELLIEKREYFLQKLKQDEDFCKEYPIILGISSYSMGIEDLDKVAAQIAYKRAHIIDDPEAQKQKAIYLEKVKFLEDAYNQEISYSDFCKESFPIIEAYFSNWHLAKLRPRATGQFDQLIGKTVEEAYVDVKRYGFFGDTEDI